MEFVHCHFGQFEYTEAQIDRSVYDYVRFLLCTPYEIVTDDVSVECDEFSNKFLSASRINNQFEVHSFSEAFHGPPKNHSAEIFVLRL